MRWGENLKPASLYSVMFRQDREERNILKDKTKEKDKSSNKAHEFILCEEQDEDKDKDNDKGNDKERQRQLQRQWKIRQRQHTEGRSPPPRLVTRQDRKAKTGFRNLRNGGQCRPGKSKHSHCYNYFQ
jgi:hypothetical protein